MTKNKAFGEWWAGFLQKNGKLFSDLEKDGFLSRSAFHAGWAAAEAEYGPRPIVSKIEFACPRCRGVLEQGECAKCGFGWKSMVTPTTPVDTDTEGPAKEEGGDKRGVVVSPPMCPRCGLRQLASALTPEAAGRGLAYRETLTCVQCGYQELL